jgi:hypothetical protein
MNLPKFRIPQSYIDHEIEVLFEELDTKDAASEEYAQITDQIMKFYKMKEDKRAFLKDLTIKSLGVFGTLSAIATIMNFERENVIGTKAFGFIPRIG